MSLQETTPVAGPDSVRAPVSGGMVGSRRCPVCRTVPLTDRQEVCSARCRAARWRQRARSGLAERDSRIGLLLRTAEESLAEAKRLPAGGGDTGR